MIFLAIQEQSQMFEYRLHKSLTIIMVICSMTQESAQRNKISVIWFG